MAQDDPTIILGFLAARHVQPPVFQFFHIEGVTISALALLGELPQQQDLPPLFMVAKTVLFDLFGDLVDESLDGDDLAHADKVVQVLADDFHRILS